MKKQYTQKLSRPEPIPNTHGDASRGARQAIGSVGKRELACSKGTSYKGAMLGFLDSRGSASQVLLSVCCAWGEKQTGARLSAVPNAPKLSAIYCI